MGELETVMGKVQFTTSPTVALNRPYVEASGADMLSSLAQSFTPTGTEVALELAVEVVVQIVKWAASALE